YGPIGAKCPECFSDVDYSRYVMEQNMRELEKKVAEANARAADLQRQDDPWIHRSKGMKCKTCMWFVPKVVPKSGVLGQKEPETYDLGRCRRHAPTMSG